ncbi:lipase family protein [Pseudorhodoferax sp.]|uniref:lipase family protein n=1 Tax=Pseudorhodoferax sp. TaxID=1993553 RepID=UPI0039E428F5
MHQGFIRAFSWLWYGTEPVFNLREFRREAALAQFTKYIIVFFGPILAWLILNCFFPTFGTATQALGVSLLVGFLVANLENGVIEDFFLKTDRPTGRPLGALVRDLNKYDRVIFTGHSLGGAIASVAFAIYRTWCKTDASRRDNGHLVTFGSGRLGDETFVNSFEQHHASRFIHIQHPGDPVPQIPPNGLFELVARRFPIRGFGGFLLSLAFIPWTVYKYAWHVPRPARWSANVVDHMNEPPFRRLCVTFHSMKLYKKYTKDLLDTAPR